MADRDLSFDIAFFRAFHRPAWVVMMVAQMILGLALAITIILKIYMLVLTSHVCEAESTTLGNLIRCTGYLEIIAHYVLAFAGFRFAAFMFYDRPRLLIGPMLLGIAGTFLLMLSGLTLEGATWPIAAVLAVLFVSLTTIVAGQTLLSRLRSSRNEVGRQ